MKTQSTDSEPFEVQSRKNSIQMVAWIFAWTATMVLADKAELYQWFTAGWQSMFAVGLNAALGLGMILSFIRFLKQLDELQRKIQFDALAFAVGAGMVGGFTISLLATMQFIADAEASDVILVMAVGYMAATVFGQLKYR